jgi:hypothetical protein
VALPKLSAASNAPPAALAVANREASLTTVSSFKPGQSAPTADAAKFLSGASTTMTDLASMQAQLDALKKARASGTSSVSIANGMTVEYKSDKEMAQAIASLENEIAAAQGTAQIRNVVVRSKGWQP